jgi:hypothetical protein
MGAVMKFASIRDKMVFAIGLFGPDRTMIMHPCPILVFPMADEREMLEGLCDIITMVYHVPAFPENVMQQNQSLEPNIFLRNSTGKRRGDCTWWH